MTSNHDIPAVVDSQLPSRPVVVLPSWESARSGQLSPYQEQLLECRPDRGFHPLLMALPGPDLDSSRDAHFRTELLAKWTPELTVYVRGLIPGVHPQFVLALTALRPVADAHGPIRLFEVPTDLSAEAGLAGIAADLRRLKKMKGGTSEFGYVLRQMPPPPARLGFARHDPRLAALRNDLANFGSTVPIKDLFEIVPQASLLPRNRHQVSRSDPDAARVLTGRDIRSDGIVLDDETSTWVAVPPDRQLRAGDVVIRAISAPRMKGGFVLTQVAEEDLPLAASPTVHALRLRPDIPPVTKDFVLRYLASPQAARLAQGTELNGHVRLTPTVLTSLHVPVPDEKMTAALAAVQMAEGRAAEWSHEAADLLGSIFDEPDAKKARDRVQRSSRVMRWRIDAAALTENFSYQIRTRFPHPIAYRWRVAEAALSDGPTSEGYRSILEAAEVLLAYLACVALAAARSAGIQMSHLPDLQKKFAIGQGPTMGDWVAILQEVTGKRFRALDEDFQLGELQGFLGAVGVRDAQRRLSQRRNDEAHIRRVDPHDLPQACAEATQDLMTILQAAEFAADVPLLLLGPTRWDSLAASGEAEARSLMGDHPVVPKRSIQVTRPDLEAGSLYIKDPNERLHLLRPLLVSKDCPTCRNLSTFHVDRVSDRDVVLKSLEHGHTVSAPDMRSALTKVGLLGPGQP
ncbi:hypothetical protein ACI78V_14745 [Geodermatophilus sp. SYSU D00742]